MEERNKKGQFIEGNKRPEKAGRRKGSKNKNTILKDILAHSINKNIKKVIVMLDRMYFNKADLKWLLQLKATLEPKTTELKGTGLAPIINIIRADRSEKEEVITVIRPLKDLVVEPSNGD